MAKTNKNNPEKAEIPELEIEDTIPPPDTGKEAFDASAGKTETLQDELSAEREKYLRLAAEYDNFRKRSQKERDGIYSNVRADTILRLLPVYDNLERALNAECTDTAFKSGVEMTMSQLKEILESMGVSEIPAVGEVFDPNRHNAVMTIEDSELGEKVIAQEYEKGFMLGDKIIRFSVVVVAN